MGQKKLVSLQATNKTASMKKFTLFTITCILLCCQIQAQSIHTWKMGPLTWNDFAHNTAIEKQVSHLEYYMGIESKTQEVDGVSYTKPSAYAFTSPEYSWVDTNYLSDQLLEYNQCIFDLVEVYRRKLENKLQDSSVFSPGQLLDNTMRQLGDEVHRIELDTQNGTDTAALQRWQDKVQKALNEVSPAPAYGHIDAPFSWGMSFDLGFHYTGGEVHDYFSHGGGMSMNFEMGYKRALLGGALYIGGDRFRHDSTYFDQLNYYFLKRDPLTCLNLYAYCGYAVIDNNTTRLIPFVGYGMLGYYYNENEESSSVGPTNGCFHFGLIYNHIFNNYVNNYWGMRDYFNAEHNKAYVDVRLYGTYNNFKNIGGAPQGFTLNLQVGIGLNYSRTHCK